MPGCSLCDNEDRISREDIIYTLKRTGLSTMTDSSVTLTDVKEHKFPLCEGCIRKDKRLKLIMLALMLVFLTIGMVIIFKLTPDNDLWFIGAAMVIGSLVFGFLVPRFFSDLATLKKRALNERNMPGYTAMAKGDYDAFSKAAKWNRGEFD